MNACMHDLWDWPPNTNFIPTPMEREPTDQEDQKQVEGERE